VTADKNYGISNADLCKSDALIFGR